MTKYRKLKPKPGRSGERVAHHQRRRLHAAMVDLVSERGYRALTVSAIVDTAGVSTHTFYENFNHKEDCFLSTYDLLVRHTAREILAARQGQEEWQEKARAAFRTFARIIAEMPKAAQLVLFEALACQAGVSRMTHTNGLFEALVAESIADRGVQPSPPLIGKAIVAGAIRIARARLLAGEERWLVADADELTRWALSLPSEVATEIHASALRASLSETPPAATNSNVCRTGQATNTPNDERAMILCATIGLAASEGYDALTAPRIRSIAGVSKRRFDQSFGSVYECFMAALEMRMGALLKRAEEAYVAAESWPRGVYRALATTCREVADDPILARLAFVEIFALGREAVRWSGDQIARQAAFLRQTGGARRLTQLAAEASIGAAWAIVHRLVSGGRIRTLPHLAAPLTYVLLAPAIGPEASREAIRLEAGDAAASSGPSGNRRLAHRL